ncbi:unnamed protein product [Paramecium pentaurelia]|uniref:Uncharacterized protein n=1 Tax=Paramecium pentaurelia TaxID=43138 RepID=A0A8S1TVV6_9CILI|nr:unnamed protein product [Paramecium pentaurelia]
MSNDTGVQKKKHKYIDSEEEEQQQQQPVQQPQQQSPIAQTITVDYRKWKFLFEPDSSEQQEEKKVKKNPNPQITKQKQPEQRVKQIKSNPDTDDLRYEILCRWWYCFDQWPPSDFDYEEALSKYKLRKVDLSVFKRESEINDQGLRKVYEVNGYKGVFRTSAGDTLDLRPREGCPSYEQISKINSKNLPKILIKGLKAQLEDLIKHEPNNQQLKNHLERQLKQIQQQYQRQMD